jgi:hypothetical protein
LNNVEPSVKEKFKDLLREFEEFFVGFDKQIGLCNYYEHKTETGSTEHQVQGEYRTPI